MRKMKNLISQLYLLALLTLPLIATACSDDDDLKAEITTLGIENGTTVNVGQVVQLEAQINNLQGDIAYTWQVNGEDVSTESSYTFIADKKGTYTINLSVTNNNKTVEKSLSINAQMYPSSFFVINEGKYGETNGSINFYSQGNWEKQIVQGGATSTVGVIHNNYMYLVSKGSPYLVKMNLSDYSVAGKIENGLGDNGQGNSICIVNDNTGILATTNGAFKVNLNSMTVGEKLSNMDANLDKEDIYKTENYIFILSMNKVKVYNANDLTFKKEITNNVTTGFAQTKDGTLWAANGNKLIKINTTTLASEEVELPNELSVYYNQWAYTPTGLCASTTENALYFAQMITEGSSVYGKNIYKYNTETKSATKFFSTPADDQSVYGAGVQVDPRNGDVYLIYTEDGWGTPNLNTNIYIADGVSGAQKAIIDYTGTYWYPSSITFPQSIASY